MIFDSFQVIMIAPNRANEASEGNLTVRTKSFQKLMPLEYKKLFNKMLEELEQSTVPRVKENWNQLKDEEKDSYF